MKWRMFAKLSFPERSARCKATVRFRPLAASAAAIVSFEENFPVPRNSREWNARPAMIRDLES